MDDYEALIERSRRLRRIAASNKSIASDLCYEVAPLGDYWELRRAHHQRLLQSGDDVYSKATRESSRKYTRAKLYSGGEWFAAADWLATRVALSRDLSRDSADIKQVLSLVVFQAAEQLQDFESAGVC